MTKREELVQLSGQVINGIMSADESAWSKIIDRTLHEQVADAAVDIALAMQKRIDKYYYPDPRT